MSTQTEPALATYRVRPYGDSGPTGGLAVVRSVQLTPDGRQQFYASLSWDNPNMPGERMIVWHDRLRADYLLVPDTLDEVAVCAILRATDRQLGRAGVPFPDVWTGEDVQRWRTWRIRHGDITFDAMYAAVADTDPARLSAWRVSA